MESSSRLFVRNLPPSITPEDFRNHFSMGDFAVTDAKVIPQRRIGYLGYKSSEDATKAVRYFDKTFIRMSRIRVELARSVGEANTFFNSMEPSIVDPNTRKQIEEQGGLRPIRKRNRKTEAPNSDHETNNKISKRPRAEAEKSAEVETADRVENTENISKAVTEVKEQENIEDHAQTGYQEGLAVNDEDWLRSRTSRLLGLLDDNEGAIDGATELQVSSDFRVEKRRPPSPAHNDTSSQTDAEDTEAPEITEAIPPAQVEDMPRSSRLFVRNISYTATEEDLRAHFEAANKGVIDEIHLSVDHKTNASKGIAFVQYHNADSAKAAMLDLDGKAFQGRLLHILPGEARRELKVNDFEISKLPLKKQQQLKRRSEASSSAFNWNSLYMNADAVVSSISQRLGVSKAELLDHTSSDAAVRQAHAETHIIQETKSYFLQHGVDLDAFQKKERGNKAILVKNFPFDTRPDDLKRHFEEFGIVSRFLVPPAGTIAIVEFEQPDNARAAYQGLVYRKLGGSILFLEKAPKDMFKAGLAPNVGNAVRLAGVGTKASAADLLARGIDDTVLDTSTLFIGNISFSTTSDRLAETFRILDGFLSARLKMRADPKKKGSMLSMGIGFVEFKTKQQAQRGLAAMDGQKLDGHALKVRASRSLDAAEERRKEDRDKQITNQRTKIIIKNLPFEVSKKDVRSLFGAYGKLRSVRVPKKIDSSSRGFAFADFITAKEAENAMEALKNTHLLGRRLVLDFAAEDTVDPEEEIEAMQQKAGHQANNIALQRLTGAGRKKFIMDDDHDPESLQAAPYAA